MIMNDMKIPISWILPQLTKKEAFSHGNTDSLYNTIFEITFIRPASTIRALCAQQ